MSGRVQAKKESGIQLLHSKSNDSVISHFEIKFLFLNFIDIENDAS